MGLQDYTYRLKAQSGDTAPHDELAVSGDLSGGTITLVDRGSGDYAWEFSGGPASVAIPSDTLTATTGGGYTIAMRVRISNFGTVDNCYFVGVGASAPSGATDNGGGTGFGRLTSGTARARYKNETTTLSWTQGTTADKTIVLVMEMNYSGGSDRLTAYYDATSASSGSGTATAATIDTVWVQALNSAVIQVADLVVWTEELPAADCQALRDGGINATLDGAATAAPPPRAFRPTFINTL